MDKKCLKCGSTKFKIIEHNIDFDYRRNCFVSSFLFKCEDCGRCFAITDGEALVGFDIDGEKDNND